MSATTFFKNILLDLSSLSVNLCPPLNKWPGRMDGLVYWPLNKCLDSFCYIFLNTHEELQHALTNPSLDIINY